MLQPRGSWTYACLHDNLVFAKAVQHWFFQPFDLRDWVPQGPGLLCSPLNSLEWWMPAPKSRIKIVLDEAKNGITLCDNACRGMLTASNS